MRPKLDWEFNLLGVDNYTKFCFKQNYYRFIKENHEYLPGNICEFGVFKGRSLLATALLLKELGSDKQVYGFDTFCGFPAVPNPNDDPAQFDTMLKNGVISQDHYDMIIKSRRYLELKKKVSFSSRDVSTSTDFSETGLDVIQAKIDMLELDNIHLIQGPFQETLSRKYEGVDEIMVGLIDSDLYESYALALPYIWQRLCKGGYVYLDEYYSLKFPGARLATNSFFEDKQDKPQRHLQAPGDFERWYVRKLFSE